MTASVFSRHWTPLPPSPMAQTPSSQPLRPAPVRPGPDSRTPGLPDSRSAPHMPASRSGQSEWTSGQSGWHPDSPGRSKSTEYRVRILPLCKKFRNTCSTDRRSAQRGRIELAIGRADAPAPGLQITHWRPYAPNARASRYVVRRAREASKTPLFTFVSLARAIPHGSRRGWRRWKALGVPDDRHSKAEF